jgi:hypothetical protein
MYTPDPGQAPSRPASGPTKFGPTESVPTESVPTESGPTESVPTESGPTESGPTASGPTESGPAESGHRASPMEPKFDPCDALDREPDEFDDLDDLDADDFDDLDDLDADDFDDLAALARLRDLLDEDEEDDPADFFAIAPPESSFLAAICGDDPPLDPLEQLEVIRDEIDRFNPPGTSPVWVRIFGSRDPLHGRINPDWAEMEGGLERLMGWTAPANCLVVGIAAGGQIRQLQRHELPASGTADPDPDASIPTSGRAQTVCVLDRQGRWSGRTSFPDGSTLEHAPEAGRLPDALRRCFGLATAPPKVSSSELLQRMWLGKIAAAASGGAVALSWDQVRRLHPAADALKAAGAPLSDELIDAGIKVAPDAWTWKQIRAQAAEGGWDQALIPANLADWMDEGMFSRWVLEGTRTASELLEAVLPWMAPSAKRRLRRAVC